MFQNFPKISQQLLHKYTHRIHYVKPFRYLMSIFVYMHKGIRLDLYIYTKQLAKIVELCEKRNNRPRKKAVVSVQ
jgi:hypothetical protein